MFYNSMLACFIILAIVAVNVWHKIASYFVHTMGIGAGLVLLAAILLFAATDPYSEEED